MSKVLRAGVIGAGVFGGYHAAKYAALEGVRLAGVYDHHLHHAQALVARAGGEAFATEAELIAAVDLVSVATPAVAHAPAALAAISAGRAVYVEKPVAADAAEAEEIAALAEARGVVAACGFLERAGLEAAGIFAAPERPRLMEAVRLGPPSPRNLDVSVVLDLMIHDIDLALALGEGAPATIEAGGRKVSHALLDEVEAEIEFESGFVARLGASRVATARERTLRLVYPSGEVRIDFLTGAVENRTGFALAGGFAASREARDGLGASLAAFVAAVRGERAAPLASARDGVRALDLALGVEQAMAQQGLA